MFVDLGSSFGLAECQNDGLDKMYNVYGIVCLHPGWTR